MATLLNSNECRKKAIGETHESFNEGLKETLKSYVVAPIVRHVEGDPMSSPANQRYLVDRRCQLSVRISFVISKLQEELITSAQRTAAAG